MQKNTLKLFWRFSRRYKFQRSLALFFPMLAVVINAIAAPYVLSLFINKLQAGHITFDNSVGMIVLYGILIFLGEMIVWRLALYFSWTFEVNAQRDINLAVFDKLSREDLHFHSNRFGGSLVSQSSKMVGAFERFWDMITWSIVPMITTIVGSIITLSIFGLWQYGLFLGLYTIVFAVVVLLCSKLMTERNRIESIASTRTGGNLADMVTNIATVKSFGHEDHEYKNAKNIVNDWHKASMRLKWGVLGATGAFSSLYAFGATGAFIFAVFAAQYHIASVGMIYLIFIYALNINRQLWEFNNVTRAYNRAISDAHEMTEILYKPYDLVDRSSKHLRASHGKIQFEHVAFTHDNGAGETVFDDFSLTIPAGQRVGIVGHSGSGKTTLTRILLRFSDIDQGGIFIDDQNIADVTQASLHHAIAYVAQEPLMFHRSMRENIAYGKPDANDEEIIKAATQAHAMEFIEKLPQGLDTVVGERGVKLSGGQRQRIAIARAILKNAPILVLDEATSALDSESEKLIQASLEDLMKSRTSIVIAHRLSTIAKLDRIIVLENGTIVEDGSHDMLIAQKGIYAKLWDHQSGGFIDE